MTTQTDKIDFITRFRDQYPDRDREECVQAAGKLLRLAARYQRLAVEYCNGGRDDNKLDRQQLACANKILTLCSEFALPVTLGGDPRGYCVHVHFPDGRGNTWGGNADGWGVPA